MSEGRAAFGAAQPIFDIVLLDPDGKPADEGEVCLDLAEQPVGLTTGTRETMLSLWNSFSPGSKRAA